MPNTTAVSNWMELNPGNQASFFKKVYSWLGAFIYFFEFIMPPQLFQNVYSIFGSELWKFKCNFLEVSLVSLEVNVYTIV